MWMHWGSGYRNRNPVAGAIALAVGFGIIGLNRTMELGQDLEPAPSAAQEQASPGLQTRAVTIDGNSVELEVRSFQEQPKPLNPLLIAGVAGGGIAMVGVLGAVALMRREPDDEPIPDTRPEPAAAPVDPVTFDDADVERAMAEALKDVDP